MYSLFDMYSDEFDKIDVEPQLMKNEKDTEFVKLIREERERTLSPYALKSSLSIVIGIEEE